MDYYFTAPDDAAAIEARNAPEGPGAGDPPLDSVEAKDIMVSPHLEQLIEAVTGEVFPSQVEHLQVLWPPAGTPPPTDESSLFLTDPGITRIPGALRDALAGLEPEAASAGRWSAELWGVEPDQALHAALAITGLARRAQAAGQAIYWRSEL